MEKVIRTPVVDDLLQELHAGDVVYISGIIVTARDEAHIHMLHSNDIPEEFRNGALYHAGPIVKREGDSYTVIALGPTTSARMNSMEKEFIDKSGIRIIIGKGGMSNAVHEFMRGMGVVYLAATGGAALVLSSAIKRVVKNYFPELGMAESIWVMDMERFGPLVVASDLHGGNLYKEQEELVNANYRKMGYG